MSVLYNLVIHLYHLLIRISAFFNPKARLWVKGRKNIFTRLSGVMQSQSQIAWFHAASLGEFEQGRPVMEAFRKRYPEYKILLTFFSPSGYEIRKNYDGADFIFYLPVDTLLNAKKFIRTVNPGIALFIKYEFWFNYINVLHHRQIPTFFISAIFRKEQHFFKWYGGWFRKRLKKISFFYVQNQESFDLLSSIGINCAKVSGDTRFDRVMKIAKNKKAFPLIEKFISGYRILLAGSSWPPDEDIITKLLHVKKWKIIIAPHEIHEDHIVSIEAKFKAVKTLRYSLADETNILQADVLIINGMGFLSSLYQYCDIAFIGGGFGKAVHNILEAVTFGKPVIFGPAYHKFKEAVDLIEKGGAFTVANDKEFLEIFIRLSSDQEFYKDSSKVCKDYIEENIGATDMIIAGIEGKI